MSGHEDRRRPAAASSKYADVDIELTLMTFRRLAPTVLLSGVGLVFTTGLIAQRANDLWLKELTAVMAVVCAVRIAIVIAFGLKPRDEITLMQSDRWHVAYGIPTFLQCLSLAVSTVYNFSHHNALASSLCTIGVFSQSAGLAARPGARPWFKQLCGLTMLAALALSVLRSDAILATTGSIMIGFFAYAHCEAVENQFTILVEQLRSRRKLRQLAEQDTLTGLANRRHFQDALAAACEQRSHPFAILYIDLDRFKAVNDTFGHQTGDRLLIEVSARLQKAVRSTDLVARLGGDEFAILQQAVVTIHDAEALARRIVRDLGAGFDIEQDPIHIGASVGIRLSSSNDHDPTLILANADSALYRVKQAGGGDFSITSL